MTELFLHKVLPEVFANQANTSELWLAEICFSKGKSYLIEAASGTGKSSLCSFIYGVRTDYQGAILFDQTPISSYSIQDWVKIRTTSLSILFQDLRLFEELSAYENIQLKNNLTQFKAEEQIKSLFDSLQIANKLHAPVGKLSYGQQQRVAFIRSLCQPFDFIFLDEPISHLDDENAQIMAAILAQEATQQGAGIIATSIGKQLPIHYDLILNL